MHAHRIHVLDEADGNHVIVLVPDNLQLQLFPAQNGFFHQDLTDDTGLQTPGADGFQFFFIINQAAASTAHGISRTQHDRIAQFIRDGQRFFHAVGNLAPGHADAQLVHGFLELDAVFTPLNGVHLHTDYFYAVFIQYAGFVQFRAQIQARLAAQVRQQCIRPFLGDDLFHPFQIQRLNIGFIRHLRVRHNRRRIGIHQYDLIAQAPQCLASLGAGIVKLAGLPDDDGAGPNDHYFMDVCSLCHASLPCMHFNAKIEFYSNDYFTIFRIKKSSAKKKCGRFSTALYCKPI